MNEENKEITGFRNGVVERDDCDGTKAECSTQHQNKINSSREKYIASLPPEMQARYQAIHDAAVIMDRAKIPFVIAAIPEDGDNMQPLALQYNRFSYKELYDKNGDITKEASLDIGENSYEILRTIASICTGMFPKSLRVHVTDGNDFVRMSLIAGKTAHYAPPEELIDKAVETLQTSKNEQAT